MPPVFSAWRTVIRRNCSDGRHGPVRRRCSTQIGKQSVPSSGTGAGAALMTQRKQQDHIDDGVLALRAQSRGHNPRQYQKMVRKIYVYAPVLLPVCRSPLRVRRAV